MPVSLATFSADVVELQSFLNGTRYYLLEGGPQDLAGMPWTVTLSLTLPKEEGEPVIEGDLTLNRGKDDWYGMVIRGKHREALDDAVDAAVVTVWLVLNRNGEAGGSLPWQTLEADLRIAGDQCAISVREPA